MTQPRSLSLQDLPAFRGLSVERLESVVSDSQILSYSIGQPLASRFSVPDTFLLILEGEARLLGHDGKRTYTIGKLTPGALVGLASLLRAAACEEASAATALKALAIPDELILQLHSSETSFQTWCNTTLQPAELQGLADSLVEDSPLSDLDPRSMFQQLVQRAELRTVESGFPTPAAGAERMWLLASANVQDRATSERPSKKVNP